VTVHLVLFAFFLHQLRLIKIAAHQQQARTVADPEGETEPETEATESIENKKDL
jgi:hypothetical protein